MTTFALAVAPPRARSNRLAYQIALAVLGSVLIAGLAQVSIRLPFTPVPITGQTLGVLLVGASLGPAFGALSVGLYLLEGALGLPFFAGGERGWGVLAAASATGGYLWGFLAASVLVGGLARRGWDRSFRSSIGLFLLGELVIYAIGVPWLLFAIRTTLDPTYTSAAALSDGLYPFVIGDMLKLLLAASLLPLAWRIAGSDGD